MKFLPYILKNLVRSKRRLVLTGGSLLVSIFLFTALAGVLYGFRAAQNNAGADLRLNVSQKYVGAWKSDMPASYVAEIAGLPHVASATGSRYIGGLYKPEDFVFGMGIMADSFPIVHDDTYKNIGEAGYKAFQADPNGALVGSSVAISHDWKVGDEVEVATWGDLPHFKFNVSAIFDDPGMGSYFLMHIDSVDDQVKESVDRVNQILVKVSTAADQKPAMDAIVAAYAQMPVQVQAQSEKAFIANTIAIYGDFQSALMLVVAAVLFAAFLTTLNALSMALRERTAEIGVLRAVGFSNRLVYALLAIEGGLMAGLGGGTGALLAWSVFHFWRPPIPMGFGDLISVPANVAIGAVLLAMVMGVVAVTLPAIAQLRQPVADVLRKVA